MRDVVRKGGVDAPGEDGEGEISQESPQQELQQRRKILQDASPSPQQVRNQDGRAIGRAYRSATETKNKPLHDNHPMVVRCRQ